MNKARITELLDECTFEFAWLAKHVYGLAIIEDKHIVINHVVSLADTILHEMIHIDDPEKSEKEVCEKTLKTLQRLTVDEIADLVAHVMEEGKIYEKSP